MATLLSAKNINKTYLMGKDNAHHVIKDVSLEIKEGEFVSVMGPSGSGKSTLLYNISGMDRVTDGSVYFAGSNIESLSEKELASLRLEKMGFVFQQSNLLKNLSIFDNIVVSAYLSGREKRAQINARANGLMEQTGISHIKDNAITQVSGGELQRAAICRALINEPALLFGDEPTGALNSSSANEVMDLLSGINREGATILLVTHDTKVAARSDRVLYMMDGQIKGEYVLAKYSPSENDLKKRETGLTTWLSKMGF
ncbi:MAG: ABC transporter ATP-binding protein [Eubacteriaceae bacterium]|nr:ABC transporter ATP-binding protein [Eubacteriaceae bacterium]